MTYGTLIQTVTVGAGGTANIDFNSIPQTFSDVVVVVSARFNDAAGGNWSDATIQFNGAGTTSHSGKLLYGNGSSVSSINDWVIRASSNTNTANTFGSILLTIPNYTSSSNKAYSIDYISENNAAGAIQAITAGLWSNTAAITSIRLASTYSTWGQYTTASLYGINPIPAASLGTTPTVDVLLVAGGGGGGGGESSNGAGGGGAGGGAGGLYTASAFAVASGTPLTVTVGAGGAGGSSNGTGNVPAGSNGSNSVFSYLTATGGGGGAGEQVTAPGNGGSGGGTGGDTSQAVGTGVAGQGNSGGAGGLGRSGGGGGGAGAAGSASSATTGGGPGGAGASSTINGFTTYYAGGGAGGAGGSITTFSLGGIGGGGNSAQGAGNAVANAGNLPGNGQANTGGGGGGVGAGNSASGGAGGSGIVIIRYPVTYNPPSATTGNPAVNYINGYRVYTWYNSGSITF